MRNYVIINGVNSNTINGLAINELPPITKPPMRVLQEEIDGRDGDITTNLGYGAYDKVMTIGLFHTFDINQIIAFFNGTGTIVFSNEPDKKYNYKIIDQIDYEKLISFKTATVTLHCQPFKYPLEETPVIIEPTIDTLENVTSASIETNENTLSTTLKGNTSQYTTTGKNLLPNDKTTTTESGVTITKLDDGTYKVNGTASADISLAICNDFISMSGTWRMVGCPSGGSASTYMLSAYVGYWGEGSPNIDTGSGTNITYTGNVKVRFFIKNGTTCNNLIFKPMLTTDTSATYNDFEPYTGKNPAPNPSYPQPVNVVTGDNTIKVCGKNLLDNSKIVKGRLDNGVIGYENNVTNLETTDNTITFTTNANYRGVTSDFINISYSDYSYIYVMWESGTTTPLCSVSYYDSAKQFISNNSGYGITNGLRYPNNVENAKYVRLYFNINTAGTQTITKPQFRFGNSTPTSYEPYQSQTYPIYLGGKNKIPTQAVYWEQGGIDATTGTDTENTTRIRTKGYYQIKNNTDYYVSIQSASYCFLNIILYNSNKSYVGQYYYIDSNINGTRGLSINIPSSSYSNVAYMRVILRNSDNISTITANEITTIKPQIELGTSATSFVEYNPIELCKIGDYQDYIYKDNGSWYIHKEIGKVVLDGTEENWYTSSGTSQVISYKAIGYIQDTTKLPCNISSNCQMPNNNIYFYNTGLSLADFKTLLGTTNAIVYGRLATPTNTEITDTELIEQLDSLMSATTYYGITNINQQNNDLPFIMDLSYMVKDTDKVIVDNIGNIYSKPTIALEGNGTGGIYLNDNQILSVGLTDKMTISISDMEAFDPDTHALLNRDVTGNYNSMTLQPSNNTIKITGGITKATITDYTRWL